MSQVLCRPWLPLYACATQGLLSEYCVVLLLAFLGVSLVPCEDGLGVGGARSVREAQILGSDSGNESDGPVYGGRSDDEGGC